MRIPAILAVALMLGACAASTGADWLGKPRAELVTTLGEPLERTPTLAGGEILVYDDKEEIRMPAAAHLSGSNYQQSGAFLERDRRVVVSCVREYETGADGVVIAARTRQGTGCLD